MKRSEKITVQAPKQRMHMALFDDDLPFRGRREEPKTAYKRKPKNRKQDDRDNW